jgi:hypothetical protein
MLEVSHAAQRGCRKTRRNENPGNFRGPFTPTRVSIAACRASGEVIFLSTESKILSLGFSTASTSRISARTPTCRHAGAADVHQRRRVSPAAKHFMHPGALHAVVRRHDGFIACHSDLLCLEDDRLFALSEAPCTSERKDPPSSLLQRQLFHRRHKPDPDT